MVDLDTLQAYNVKLKQMDNMDVTAVIKTPITKEGKKTGKFRYRLAGVGTDGTGMSKFIKQADAEDIADQMDVDIEERAPKKKGPSRSCKAIAQRAADRCTTGRGQKTKLSVGRAVVEKKKKAAPKKRRAVKKKAAPKRRKVAKKGAKKRRGRPRKKK